MTSELFPAETVEKARAAGVGDEIPSFDAPELTELQRTELELNALCPMMAAILRSGSVIDGGLAAASGQEVHEAYSWAVDEYVAAGDPFMKPAALADVIRGRLLQSRPDVQPEAIEAAWHSAYRVGEHLVEIGHPENVKKYDGGRGERSGMLAVDIPALKCRIKSEVDLLYQGPSKTVLHETDWKSGRSRWSVSSVARSFQFQCHAFLILDNYPEIEAVEIQVATTRSGGWLQPVEFRREHFNRFFGLVYKAAEAAMFYRSLPIEQVDVWPAPEKCLGCKAAARCKITPPESCAANPEAFVLSMHTLSCTLDAMHDEAAAYVKSHGEINVNGLAFGIAKPKSTKTPTASLYLTNGESKDAND